MIEETLVAILDQFAPTHPLVLPAPEPVLPAIVYQRVSGVGDHSHDGPGRVEARYQVSFWGATYKDALELHTTADAFLDGYSVDGVTILAAGTYDDEDDSTRGARPMGNTRRIADYMVSYRKSPLLEESS